MAARDACIDASLASNERVLARDLVHPVVTDRRLISPHWSAFLPQADWIAESLPLEAITSWALGRRHDRRPILRLKHDPIARLEHVPLHRVFRFEWGNAEAPVLRSEMTLWFGRNDQPVLVALRDLLEHREVPREPDFEYRPGKREDRMGDSMGTLFLRHRWRRPGLLRCLPGPSARLRIGYSVYKINRERRSAR